MIYLSEITYQRTLARFLSRTSGSLIILILEFGTLTGLVSL